MNTSFTDFTTGDLVSAKLALHRLLQRRWLMQAIIAHDPMPCIQQSAPIALARIEEKIAAQQREVRQLTGNVSSHNGCGNGSGNVSSARRAR